MTREQQLCVLAWRQLCAMLRDRYGVELESNVALRDAVTDWGSAFADWRHARPPGAPRPAEGPESAGDGPWTH